MADDARTPDDQSPLASVRELARLWVQSQSAISAYITAHVFDVHHAEDLVQEVAQAAAENFANFDRDRSFLSWVLGIARNRVLKYYRSQARDRLILSEAALERLEFALARTEHEVEDRRAALKTCLEQIQGRRREVLELRYSQNAAIADIAKRFQMSSDGVFVMLHRIRTILYGCIQRQLSQQGAR